MGKSRQNSSLQQTQALIITGLFLTSLFVPAFSQGVGPRGRGEEGPEYARLRMDVEVLMRGLGQQVQRAGVSKADAVDRLAAIPLQQILVQGQALFSIDSQWMASEAQLMDVKQKMERVSKIWKHLQEIRDFSRVAPKFSDEVRSERRKSIGELQTILRQLRVNFLELTLANREIDNIFPGDKGAQKVDRPHHRERAETQKRESERNTPRALSRANTGRMGGKHR